jgi:hypothetical protein
MLRALLEHFKSDSEKNLLSFLPNYDFANVEQCLTPEKTDFSRLLSPYAWIEEVHYSWFVSPLKTLPKATAMLALSLFSEESQAHLRTLLDIQGEIKKPSPLICRFLAQFLKTKVETEDILAIEYLPPADFNKLLALSRLQLLHLTDLLGLQDLANDVRQIVDKTLLARIYGILTKDQLAYLNYASQQPVKWPSPKLNLESWSGDKKTLLSILHKRGLRRLGLALKNENKNLQWHVCRRFDTGRGELLMKLFAGKEDPAMISYFREQALQLLTRFKI